mmetsp:Transcript_13411/g.25486  ORF Transcript_13411/g.25486 Transcript_13411/m.25486 type:complete len:905 (-) Transcript_13411:455-3169(-)
MQAETNRVIDGEKDQSMEQQQQEIAPSSFSLRWTKAINTLRKPLYDCLHYMTEISARNPKRTISFITILSMGLLVIGLATNFTVDTDTDLLWTPRDSKPVQHRKWIDDESGFPEEKRGFLMFFHNHGENIVLEENIAHAFEALDSVRSIKGYNDMCRESDYVDTQTQQNTCQIWGVTKFWSNTESVYRTDEHVIQTMSAEVFPDDGSRVDRDSLFGYPRFDDSNSNGTLVYTESFMVVINVPDTDKAKYFEELAIDLIVALDDTWHGNSTINLRVEVEAFRSFDDEMMRSIAKDIPLVPMVFIIMSVFCVIVFSKKNRLYSRSMLGLCGVVAVLMSIFAGYGLMFVCGVPFTSMTQILPFIISGIGLDDIFILTCSYDRTKRSKDPVERIRATIDDVGLSVTMTSLTSAMAFGLGCLSTIPAIFWLCIYGFPTVVLVYLFQMTFFVACMVLDDRRIDARKRDCCFCFTIQEEEVMDTASREEGVVNQGLSTASSDTKAPFVDRVMSSFAGFILKPRVKVVLALLFVALAGVLSYSASQLEQAFDYQDMLPDDSYLLDTYDAISDYQARSGAAPFVYFRYVNQSDPQIQRQMTAYIQELVTISAVEKLPDSFWLWDLEKFQATSSVDISNLPFENILDLFLQQPAYNEMYKDQIVRYDNGTIRASRGWIYMDNVDWDIVTEQIDALNDQRAVTKRQPINRGRRDWAFFTYFGGYDIWELYRVSVIELIKTTIIGVFAVSGVSLILIPHWSACLFVFPFIVLLYMDLLGWINMMGLEVNAVTYIGMVMSIGLLVDFVMHILLRYYESSGTRMEKTVSTLQTMGSSIFLGGTTTLLGTLPLAFSSNSIFFSVFVVFFGLVVLGLLHGLVFLPIILSIFGPEDPPTSMTASQLENRSSTEEEEKEATE